MPSLGIPELVIILVIVVLIFGAGRLAGVGRALGTSVKEFRDATRDEKSAEAVEQTAPAEETKV